MSITGGIGQITISFHTPSSAGAGYVSAPVALTDLTAVLDAMQRAIYSVAAHERHLPGIRNLSDEVRRHHTLVLLGVRSGDAEIELAPLSAFPRESAPTLFPQDEMARIARDSAIPVVAATAQAVQALSRCFGDQASAQSGSLASLVRRYALTLATVAIRSGQTIRLRVADDSSQQELDVESENGFHVLAQAAIERGALQRYPNCIVREVLAEETALLAEIPYYGHELMRCTYRGGPELEYAQRLNAGDEVTIIGSLRQENVIEVAAILDSWGLMIGYPILDQLVKETADN